ncbi:class I SAM-dependent methyltransferase, partial [Dapis sp. BLCC M172]|uniref:class I SAM-dependent methyltransferase n=1 Tax=Dapis sp. BLCC M172 TaxID=2975281 RepID=UPI003CEC68EF
MEKVKITDKQPKQLAATTGFLDQVAIDNETVCLSGWVLSFESEPVTNFKVLFGNKQLTEFRLTQGLPSPGVKKAHPNISAANNARFIIRLPMKKEQQQEFKNALIILIPLVENREGEPLLNAVNPALSSLVKTPVGNNLQTTTPQVELISVHVPKAAGTAFRQVLLQVYGTQGVLTDKTNMFEENMPPTIHWQTKVIEGHFRAGKYDKFFPNAKRITWLREPIRRLISDYCFRHISNPRKDHLNKESLLKFAQGNSNLMTYCLNGKSLDYFYFVGITEYFAEDLLELKNIFGWSDYEVIYQNRNPYPEYVEFQKEVLSDRKLMDKLAAANSQDMELYAAALKLSEGRRKKEERGSTINLPLLEGRSNKEEGRITTNNLPEENMVNLEEYLVTGKIELLRTLGSLDKAEFDNQELLLTGWVVAPNSGEVKGFKLTIANTKIEKFETALNLPSPDVRKLHPSLNNSGQSRFRIKVPLNQEQISQFQNDRIALIPIFKDGEGKVLLKELGYSKLGTFSEYLKIVEEPKFIAPIKTITTLGYFEKVTISNRNLVISGWVGSYNFGSVKGFKISIGGQEITKFKHSLGIYSPDIKKAFPKLAGAENARFQVTIPVSESQILEFQDCVLSLTPLFKDAKGKAIVKVVNFVGKTNKIVDYKIVDSHIILSDETSIPFPPEFLVDRVHGESEINGFLNIGLGISRDLKLALNKIGKKFSDFDSVLDFGCGCGRVIIWNYLLSKSTVFEGIDVDAEAIYWCQENLKFAKFSVNQALPPTEYEDNKFDFVYLISVFSHINEEMQLQWLKELRRITKPEGIVMITTRGPNISREAYDLTTKLEKEGLLFFTSPDRKKVFPDWYQTTYQTEDYIRNKWVSEFEIIDFIPGGIRASQDIVILKNKEKLEPVAGIDTKEKEILETLLLATTGYLEYIGLADKKELSIRGWVAAAGSGILENMKVVLGEIEIQNFQLKKAIPSPHVKKNNSHLDAENARFELSIPLTSEQLEQCRNSNISLTPFFQKGKGTAISKRLAISIPQIKTEKETVEVSDKQVKPVEVSPSPTLPKYEKVAAQTSTVSQLQSSEFMTEIMADLEKSQVEIQEIKADLEKFKSKKTNTPAKSLFPVESDKNLSGLGEETTTKKKILTNQIDVDTNVSGFGDQTPTAKKTPI